MTNTEIENNIDFKVYSNIRQITNLWSLSKLIFWKIRQHFCTEVTYVFVTTELLRQLSFILKIKEKLRDLYIKGHIAVL